MASEDLDEAFEALTRAWRTACLHASRLDDRERAELRAWLKQTGLVPRFQEILEQLRQNAERVDYFDQGLRFSRDLIAGFARGLQLARDRGDLPRRAHVECALDALPAVVRTDD